MPDTNTVTPAVVALPSEHAIPPILIQIPRPDPAGSPRLSANAASKRSTSEASADGLA